MYWAYLAGFLLYNILYWAWLVSAARRTRSYRDALLIDGLVFMIWMITLTNLLHGAYAAGMLQSLQHGRLGDIVLVFLPAFALIALSTYVRGMSVVDRFQLRVASWKRAGAWAALGWLFLLVSSLIYVCLCLGNTSARTHAGQQEMSIPPCVSALGFLGLLHTVLGPLMEECVFRASVYAGLKQFCNYRVAVVVSALLFASVHTWDDLLPLRILDGVILAYAFEKSGTLITPIGIHFGTNTLSFLLRVFLGYLR